MEIKTEVVDIDPFENIPPENIDEIPMIQGNYNDNIIIEDEDNPLTMEEISDYSESIDKSSKKRKRHSKHTEPKKLKTKHTPKSKRKHSIIPTSNPILNVADATVQCRNMLIPDICIPRCSIAKDISNNQGKINVLPGSIISLGNELSMVNVKNKTVVNITNSGQITNLMQSGDDIGKLMNNTVENRAITNTVVGINPSLIESSVNSGCQSEIINADVKPSTFPIYKNESISTENNSTINNTRKPLIKAPRLLLSDKHNPRCITGKNASISNIPNNWSTHEARSTSSASSTAFSQPPILQREIPCSVNTGNLSWNPSLNQLLPSSDCLAFSSNTYILGSSLNPHSIVYRNNVETRFLGRTSSNDANKPLAGKKFWAKTPLRFSQDGESALEPVCNTNKQDHIRISAVNFAPPASSVGHPNAVFVTPTCIAQVYPAQITPIDPLLKTTSVKTVPNYPPVLTKITKKPPVVRATKASISRQKSQKRNTSRKKSSAKNDKSNINAFSNVPEMSNVNTSVGIQIGDPSDTDILLGINNVQNIMHSGTDSSVERNSDGIQPNTNERLNVFDKIQLQNQQDIDYSHLSSSNLKPKKSTSIRRKPKEKSRKSTTRKKQPLTETISPTTETVTITNETINPITEPTKQQSTQLSTQSVDTQACSLQATSIIPGHISDMIYPNLLNNDLLRAFNDYWGAQISHCAICATFASCSSGSSRVMPPDWRYCKPTALPENTPIWVRKVAPNDY